MAQHQPSRMGFGIGMGMSELTMMHVRILLHDISSGRSYRSVLGYVLCAQGAGWVR